MRRCDAVALLVDPGWWPVLVGQRKRAARRGSGAGLVRQSVRVLKACARGAVQMNRGCDGYKSCTKHAPYRVKKAHHGN